MKRALIVAGLLLTGGTAVAQTVSLGAQGAMGDYREVSSNLHYRGWGAGGWLLVQVGRLSVEGSGLRIWYDPKDANAGLASFDATQLDAWLGYEIGAGVTAEVGILRRTVSPTLTAQEMGGARVGLRYSKALGPGAAVALRGDYLAGARFTGGGSAGMAFELGLLVSAGPQNGRFRVNGEYGFERVDRKAGGVPVPIEQSLVRLGVAVGF
jgi:hypothetical protein